MELLLPGGGLFGTEFGAMQGGERCRVAEVARDRANDHREPAVLSEPADVLQIAAKMLVNALEPAVVGSHRAVDEHSHSRPLLRSLLAVRRRLKEIVDELTDSSPFHREIGANRSQIG